MRLSDDQIGSRLKQIESIARAEQLWSVLYFAHVGLLLAGSLAIAFLLGTWGLFALASIYVAVFTLEKYISGRALAMRDQSRYLAVMSTLTFRAVLYNCLTVAVWSIEGDIFKMAALALLVAATINIMVFHATCRQIIACVVGPIWLGFLGIALLIYWEFGLSAETATAFLSLLCISPYLYLALIRASDEYRQFEWTKQALNRSQRQEIVGRLVAGVAHDFNNVLAVALGNAELVKESTAEEETKLFAEEIIRAAQRGGSLAAQLLTFVGRTKLEPAQHDITPIVRDFENMVSRVFPENIAISTSVAPDTSAVLVDRNQLDVALLNLAINARDAMPDGGRLRLKVDEIHVDGQEATRLLDDIAVGNFVRFRLSDTGIGITREAMQKIFDPFFSTKEIGKGSGLGLSMVLGFAKQSKGTVFVESEVNKGTTFILLVPAIDRDVTVNGGPREAETLTKKCCDILLVEDELSVLQVIENQLTAHGHRVHTATNGEEAAAMLRGGLKPDVLITDNIMPGTIQGVALIQIALEHVPGVSTIMISGYPADARDQLEVNKSDTLVLTKPVKKADILQAIDESHVSL